MRVPRLDAGALRAFARALRAGEPWRRSPLSPCLRERIVLRVSAVNGCPVCYAAHAGGCSTEPLHADDGPRADVALRFAEARTRGRETPELRVELRRHFSPDERRAIRAVVDLFTFNNRFNNTWESWLPGARRRRRRLGIG